MTKDEALKLALEALEYIRNFETGVTSQTKYGNAAQVIKEALANEAIEQPAQQEPGRNHYEDGDVFERIAAMKRRTAEQEPVAVRLWDSQWVNVVNHDNCYRDWSKEDAINHAVKMTEKYIAENVANNKLPPAQQEPVSHSIVAGALFDFMGWLTSRNECLVLSSTDDAAPAADAIKDFAHMRNLSIDDAKVREWQEHLAFPPAQSKPLTDDPLQGAVDWLLEADGEYFCTATVQRTLRIGYNRAKRLCDTAKERADQGIKGGT